MKYKVKGLIVALLTVVSTAAFADDEGGRDGKGFFLEPALTVESSETNVTQADENITSYGLGARIGAHFRDFLFVGIDGRYSRPSYETQTGTDVDADEYDVGATLGAQTPYWGVRLWGTYLFEGSIDPETVAGVDTRYSGLDGYRVGAGFRVASVGVNLEYEEATYDDTTITGAPVAGTADLDGSARGLIASLSFPISF